MGAVRTKSRRRDGDHQLKRVVGLAIEKGKTDVVKKYLDFAVSCVLVEVESLTE